MNSFVVLISIFVFIALFSCTSSIVNPHNDSQTLEYVDIVSVPLGSSQRGDDDEPIIQGLVLNAYNEPLEEAGVELIDAGSGNLFDLTITNQIGEFQFEVEDGTYYFKIFEEGQLVGETDSINVNEDIFVTISL